MGLPFASAHSVAVALVPTVNADAVAVPVASVLIFAGDAGDVAAAAVTWLLFLRLRIVLFASKAKRLLFKF